MTNSRLRAVVRWFFVLSVVATSAGLYAGQALSAHDPQAGQAAALQPPANERPQPNSRAANPRTDIYGDPLPPGVLARIGSVRLHHGHFISPVIFTPDGERLISGSADGTVRVWDRSSGRELRRWSIAGLGFSNFHPLLSISHDGKIAIVADYPGRKIDFFDIAAGTHLRALQMKKPVSSPLLTPDGKTLVAAVGTYGQTPDICVLHALMGHELRRLAGHKGWLWRIALSADGNTIAAGGEEPSIHLWDLNTGKELHRLDGHENEVRALAFCPDNKTLASGSKDGTIRLWNVVLGTETRRHLLVKNGQGSFGVTAVAFSPDGKTLAAAFREDSTMIQSIHIWDVAGWKEIRRMSTSHSAFIWSLAFSPDGKVLASDGGPCIRLWDVATGKVLDPERQREISPSHLALAPNGKLLATHGWDGNIDLWDVPSGRRLQQLHGHENTVVQVAFSAGRGQLVSSSRDHTVRVWDLASGREVGRLSHPDMFGWMAVAPDGRTVATAGREPVVRVWNLDAGKELWRFPAQVAPRGALPERFYFPFDCLAFSPDGKVLAAGQQHASVVHLWDLATGKEMSRLNGPGPRAHSIAFSPDSRFLVVAEGRSGFPLVLWEVATGREVRRIAPPDPSVLFSSLAFSPDGRTLFAGGFNKTIQLYEVATGRVRHTLNGHQGDVLDGAFSADGRILVTTSWDSTALVWDMASRLAPRKLSRDELAARWADLADTDAPRAYQAVRALAGSPAEAVAFVTERLRPIVVADPKLTNPLLADLANDRFVLRDKARKELERLGFTAEPALRRALAQKPTLESRRRITALLERLDGPQTLQIMRAVEALELIGSAEARDHLRTLATGAAEARLTREAKAALERLRQQSNSPLE